MGGVDMALPGSRHVGGCNEWDVCLLLVCSLTSF